MLWYKLRHTTHDNIQKKKIYNTEAQCKKCSHVISINSARKLKECPNCK